MNRRQIDIQNRAIVKVSEMEEIMNRKEYMEQLSKAMEGIEPDTARDILEDYEAHFERALESGRSEEEIISELGSVDEFVEELGQFISEKAGDGKGAKSASDNTQNTQKKNAGQHSGSYNWDNKEFSDKISNIVNSAVNAATSGLNHLSGYFDKAFGNFEGWMSGFEKTDEKEADYQRRQEAAKYREKRSGRNSEDFNFNKSFDNFFKNNRYNYSPDEDMDGEQYMAECSGTLYQEDGIRHISIDSKSADIKITASTDGAFHYNYKNEGSAGSKIVYRLERKQSKDTIYLNIQRDEQVQRKNHFTILGGIFEEGTEIELSLKIPEWMESLVVNGKSSDISMRSCKIRTLQLKTMSGDIQFQKAQAERSMLESMSGDVDIADSKFDYVLASTMSGDASMKEVRAQKAACRSMSGDASVINSEFGEAAVTSKSGDAKAFGCRGGVLNVESMSGDAKAEELSVQNIKVSSKGGDADIVGIKAEKVLVTTISGDISADKLESDILKTSVVSGDMSIRGTSREMTLTNGSGDIIVVQHGDTAAKVSTRSGDVHFHLKNGGNGFAARVSTHGDIQYRYQDLKLNDAANGIHRYGAEGSMLDIQMTSGDLSITD